MDARIGKMTVDVWFYLPTGETRAQLDDEQAGRVILGDIGEATRLAGLLLRGGTPVFSLEITTDGAEASAEEIAAFEERAREVMEQEVTV